MIRINRLTNNKSIIKDSTKQQDKYSITYYISNNILSYKEVMYEIMILSKQMINNMILSEAKSSYKLMNRYHPSIVGKSVIYVPKKEDYKLGLTNCEKFMESLSKFMCAYVMVEESKFTIKQEILNMYSYLYKLNEDIQKEREYDYKEKINDDIIEMDDVKREAQIVISNRFDIDEWYDTNQLSSGMYEEEIKQYKLLNENSPNYDRKFACNFYRKWMNLMPAIDCSYYIELSSKYHFHLSNIPEFAYKVDEVFLERHHEQKLDFYYRMRLIKKGDLIKLTRYKLNNWDYFCNNVKLSRNKNTIRRQYKEKIRKISYSNGSLTDNDDIKNEFICRLPVISKIKKLYDVDNLRKTKYPLYVFPRLSRRIFLNIDKYFNDEILSTNEYVKKKILYNYIWKLDYDVYTDGIRLFLNNLYI
jgi:hypothetical protein